MILHLIGQMERGGAERQLLYLVRALKERGWQQAVVTFDPGEVWDRRLVALDVPFFGIPRSLHKLRRLWQLRQIVRQQRPTIIHSWSVHTGLYARWLLSYPKPHLIMRIGSIPTVHKHTGERLRRVPKASVYAAADCVISNSLAALECLRAAGMWLRRSEVISNIVVTHNRARPGEAVSVPRIVAAGILIPLKGYDVLFRALGELVITGYQFELLLAGDGPERSNLEELARDLCISRQVKFMGGIDDVPDLFSTAHMLVHPSRSEGQSNTILDAMAEGLPVIASSVGGIPELISDGKTGILVPPDQPALLAAKIRQLLDSPALRHDLGRAGFELVRERHTIDEVTRKFEQVYGSFVYS
jgi:glycosyltransferase involved in cell wall biosynthesis